MWHDMFSLPLPVVEKVLRALLLYGFLVAALRVVGKRELGQTNTLDLVVLLLVANAVQNGIIGADNSVTGAVVGAVTLFAVNEAVSRVSYAFPRVANVVEGEPSTLVADGRPEHRALRDAGISMPQLLAIARRQGFRDLDEVDTAILETNGVVSMFRSGEEHVRHRASAGGARAGKRRRGE
jgi:uncharacterized membrane protein YcaP (DUF421 family)